MLHSLKTKFQAILLQVLVNKVLYKGFLSSASLPFKSLGSLPYHMQWSSAKSVGQTVRRFDRLQKVFKCLHLLIRDEMHKSWQISLINTEKNAIQVKSTGILINLLKGQKKIQKTDNKEPFSWKSPKPLSVKHMNLSFRSLVLIPRCFRGEIH